MVGGQRAHNRAYHISNNTHAISEIFTISFAGQLSYEIAIYALASSHSIEGTA
ncbi:unnamed protein product [Penicillium roqueforti FM164]|uniref:Genomic scaffold, ProqFM164S01 n=1 Tax=Penicillium roqueforti (strain FM164) TaxID=1365484 RepID=W6PZ61_PENRF|nr:unnamed protein product [Penicillium roqueforti FM164]